MIGVRRQPRGRLAIVAAALLVAAVAILARPTAFVLGLDDPTEANQQLIALSGQLTGSLTRDRLLAIARAYPLLTVRTEAARNGRWVVLRTPTRFARDNWVAWLEFDTDRDVLIRGYFGTVDCTPTPDKPTGMPKDVCFGSELDCRRAWF